MIFVLEHLDGVKKNGKGYVARCPAHQDKNPSLSVREAEDRILMHCFKGCDIKDICAAIGIQVGDLFNDRPALRLEVRKKIDTSSRFEQMRNDAFVEMARVRDEYQAIFDEYLLEVPDVHLEKVHKIPLLNYYLEILATGSKGEVMELMKEGVIQEWARLSNLQKKKKESSKELALMST